MSLNKINGPATGRCVVKTRHKIMEAQSIDILIKAHETPTCHFRQQLNNHNNYYYNYNMMYKITRYSITIDQYAISYANPPPLKFFTSHEYKNNESTHDYQKMSGEWWGRVSPGRQPMPVDAGKLSPFLTRLALNHLLIHPMNCRTKLT